METLAAAIGWILAIFLGLLGGLFLWQIWTGTIDLKNVVSEGDGKASLSRFQFLVFTFVIAMSFLLVVVGNTPLRIPEVPPGVYALLGISGGSYLVSKGIQKSQNGGKPGPSNTGDSSGAAGEGEE